jgi:exodeoxyribonuclease V alpha subunit
MSEELVQNESWELEALGRSIGVFLRNASPQEEAELVEQLGSALAKRVGEGGSHLSAEETLGFADVRELAQLKVVGTEEEVSPLVLLPSGALYLRRQYECERAVVEAISLRAIRRSAPPSAASARFFKETLLDSLDENQRLAVASASLRDFAMISGGPGTGKTRAIVVLLAFLLTCDENLRVALAAPTGKAAFRMRESVLTVLDELSFPNDLRDRVLASSNASTIHRLLGSKRDSMDFRHNSKHPLSKDLIIVDEASMVDLSLMSKLLSALNSEAKIILIGDADQLTPVQGGPVFSGLAKAFAPNRFSLEDLATLVELSVTPPEPNASNDLFAGCYTTLSRAHRQEGHRSERAISELCSAIREGRSEDALYILDEHSRDGLLQRVEKMDSDNVEKAILEGFSPMMYAASPRAALDAFGKFRILCTLNHGRYGVESWNHKASDLLADIDDRATPTKPVVVTRNDYPSGLFNGDDGIVRDKRAYFRGEGQDAREVAASRLPGHLPAYATTIHRCQGSEYDKVMIILPPAASRTLTRELLYVAISRAREGILVVGSEDAFRTAVDQPGRTCTGVPELLQALEIKE